MCCAPEGEREEGGGREKGGRKGGREGGIERREGDQERRKE